MRRNGWRQIGQESEIGWLIIGLIGLFIIAGFVLRNEDPFAPRVCDGKVMTPESLPMGKHRYRRDVIMTDGTRINYRTWLNCERVSPAESD